MERVIDEMNSLEEKWWEEFHSSDSFKFGYCRSAINTALWLLDLDKVDQAKACLRDCSELMRDKPAEDKNG